MTKDEPLPSIPVEPVSRPVHHTRVPRRVERRIRWWRSPDVEQQSAEWRRAHMRQIEESDVFWKLRMRNRP